MKKFVVVLSAVLFITPNVIVASLPLESRPFLAVYVSGHYDPNVNRFLATELTRALARTERYREASRYEEFLLFVESWQLSEGRIIEIARDHGIQQLGIVSMTSILGSYAITLKIVNVETDETIANGEIDNSLASLADIRAASVGLIETMFGTATPAPTIQPTPTYAEVAPAPTHAPTPQQRQFIPQMATIINTDAIDYFFAPKWLPTTDGLAGFNLEVGQIRGDGWMWSIDGGRTNLADRYPHTWNITANIGDIWTFANNMHFAYGGSVGFGEQAERARVNDTTIVSRDAVYFGPFVRWSWRQYIELTYRGLIGETYINQAMLGLNLRTNNRHSSNWQPRERNPRWKNHWAYLGGSFGVGWYNDYVDWNASVFERDRTTAVAGTFVADFPLLSWFGIETGAIIGNNLMYGLSSMSRIGFISERSELTGDLGFVLGSMTVFFGGTTGFKIGSGMLFFRYQFAQDDYGSGIDGSLFSAGYKVGVGRRRVGN